VRWNVGPRWKWAAAGVAVLAIAVAAGLVAALILAAAAIALYLTKPGGSGSPAWSARRRRATVAAVAIALFLVLSLLWTVFLLSATVAGECSYEEVRCSSLSEFMSEYGEFFYLALLPPSVVLAWAIVRRHRGTRSERNDDASATADRHEPEERPRPWPPIGRQT
jgi:Mn2+/Fe2+ NRAMP family transporter